MTEERQWQRGFGWDAHGSEATREGSEVCGTKEDPLLCLPVPQTVGADFLFWFVFPFTLAKKKRKIQYANTHRGAHMHIYTDTVGKLEKTEVRQL